MLGGSYYMLGRIRISKKFKWGIVQNKIGKNWTRQPKTPIKTKTCLGCPKLQP